MWVAKLKFPKSLHTGGRRFVQGVAADVTAEEAEVLKKDDRFSVYPLEEAHLHEAKPAPRPMVPRKSVRRMESQPPLLDTADARREPEQDLDEGTDQEPEDDAQDGEPNTPPDGESAPSEPQGETAEGQEQAPKGTIRIVRKSKAPEVVDPSTAGAVEI